MNEYVIWYTELTWNEYDGNTSEVREERFRDFEAFYNRYKYLFTQNDIIFDITPYQLKPFLAEEIEKKKDIMDCYKDYVSIHIIKS